MKIKKTLFSTEIEVTPDELDQFTYRIRDSIRYGLFIWLKQQFKLNLYKKRPKVKK